MHYIYVDPCFRLLQFIYNQKFRNTFDEVPDNDNLYCFKNFISDTFQGLLLTKYFFSLRACSVVFKTDTNILFSE